MRTDSNANREQEDLRRLRNSLSVVDRWLSRAEPYGWTVQRGSPLAGDDKKSDPFHVSHAVISCIGVAVDHAHALKRLVDGCANCAPTEITFLLNSYYSLLRGALENASRAVWLLAPDTRPERVLRRLRLQADNVTNSDKAAAAFGASMSKPRDVRLARVREIAVRAGVEADTAVKRLDNLQIMQGAGEYIGGADCGDHIVGLWRACSGAAHGDVWAGLSLHDKEIIDHDGHVATTRFTAATPVVTTFVSEIFVVIDTAHRLFDLRNRPPY